LNRLIFVVFELRWFWTIICFLL